ncbi:hypothetical protein M0657_004494 [Pyricularia oryzae]|uniref:Uncharacterized protein n=1 Tax=Pyricularia oryzae TaxID=318829 RepID=A0A4P7NA71_PYROR|nr:hypothetical protein M0657_004494 [Pyricularia oryzae]KAI7925241.1 hypothetical protein M9X92_003420 [Pyricularia oryzae]QBZ57054.1 hypothetical protein PoMZ_01974 [Pyricularia oryzae]
MESRYGTGLCWSLRRSQNSIRHQHQRFGARNMLRCNPPWSFLFCAFTLPSNPSSSHALTVKIRPVAVAKLGVHSKPSQGGALALEESTVRRWWFVRDTLLPRSHPT